MIKPILAIVFSLTVLGMVHARSPEADKAAHADWGRWIVLYDEPPVLEFQGTRDKAGGWAMAPTDPEFLNKQFDHQDSSVKAYKGYLAERHAEQLTDFQRALGRDLKPVRSYSMVSNGVALDLSADEANRIRLMPGIRAVFRDQRHHMLTDSGPAWIGAPLVWDGTAAGAGDGNLGEGAVVGVFDSGVNWDNPAFFDIGGDGYDHDNPLPGQLGLCSLTQVLCNDKLVGVYDFTNEGTNGKDTTGHGSHVAATAVGNRRNAVLDGITVSLEIPVSGVAPHASMISYKVCNADDPNTPEDEEGCSSVDILAAMDQAVIDDVSVVNYSLGGGQRFPWSQVESPIEVGMINMRAAGVLVVSSAGNGGSGEDTISSPALAPWVMAIGNISHNRRLANTLEMMMGGDSTPPPDLNGVGVTTGFGPAPIVHASEFGNALCAVGNPELQGACNDNTGASNPFPPGTFNGEIVVCDRGTFGRVEKGFNVRAAGAGGYVLINTDSQGESVNADDHCLPAVHLGDADGDVLRAWLADGGTDHSAVIGGLAQQFDDSLGDQLNSSSSRGPVSIVPDVMKPDLSAPGTGIFAADGFSTGDVFLTGTSMASPHVAGVAALLVSGNRAMTPSQIHSALILTAVNDGMRAEDGVTLATTSQVGAGRARADRAIGAGLYLNITANQFRQADPSAGGDPGDLNLPTLVDQNCFDTCEFARTVTDLDGGGEWTVTIVGDDGLTGTVDPASFTLAAGGSQALTITVDVSEPNLVGRQNEGLLRLENVESGAVLNMPISVFGDPGNLPDDLIISTPDNQGSVQVGFSGVVALPDAQYQTLGLELALLAQQTLFQDPTRDDPYDNLDQGVFFESVTVTDDGGLVLAETIPLNNGDLDLFVGRDVDGDGPEASEELCSSTSSGSLEQCILKNVDAGDYWILVQNWEALGFGDNSRLRYVALQNRPATSLVATGPGNIVDKSTPFDVRLIWDRGAMKSGERWYGALIPKTSREAGVGELGRIIVQLIRQTAAPGDPLDPQLDNQPAYAIAPGESAIFALAAGEGHGRLFVDVPANTAGFTVSSVSTGEVDLFVVRDDAVFTPPQVTRVSGLDTPLAQATQAGGNELIEITGSPTLAPGRYYIVPVNTSSTTEVRVTIDVDITSSGNTVIPTQGLWFNPQRNGAGFNLNIVNDQLIIEWYTYLEDGTPTWYLAQGLFPQTGNSWNADLLYFNWNGLSAAPTVVGEAILVFDSATDLSFNYRVNGRSGSEPYTVIAPDLSCLTNGEAVTRTGLWFLPSLSGFGYSILSLGGTNPQQVHVNYLYDGLGFPRWVLGQGDVLTTGSLVLSQFSGFCPGCDAVPAIPVEVGNNVASFIDAFSGEIATDLTFTGSVPGAWSQTGSMANLTPGIVCP